MTTFIEVIKHTPTWVWILFIFLIRRGISALKDREMTPRRLFMMPVIFFAWGVYSLTQQTMFMYISLVVMFASLLVGFGIGWVLWRSKPRLYSTHNGDLIVRPGTSLTLCFILMTFIAKFALAASHAMYPALYSTMHYNILLGFVAGFFDGIFWGGTLNLFIPWYKSLEAKK